MLGTPGGGAGRDDIGGGGIGARGAGEDDGGPEVGVGPILSVLVPRIPFICCRCLI